MKYFYTYLLSSILLFCSCNSSSEKKVISVSPKFDTAAVLQYRTMYDSLYDEFNRTIDFSMLAKADSYADSLLAFRNNMLPDSMLRKKYLTTLSYRAQDYTFLHQFGKSLELTGLFFHTYDSLHLPADKFYYYAKNYTANIYTRYGDYKKAISFLNEVYQSLRLQDDQNDIVSVAINLSSAYNEIQQFDSSMAVLLQANKYTDISTRRKSLIAAALANAYLNKKDTSNAILYINKAKSVALSAVDEGGISDPLNFAYELEADVQLGKKNYPAAKQLYRQSLYWMLKENTVFRRREVGKLLNNMGKACEDAGEIDSALYYYHKALFTVADIDTANLFSLPQQKDIYAENTILESLDNMAGCMMKYYTTENKQQWLTHAVNCFTICFEVERKLMLNFSYDESKYQMLQLSRQRSEKAIDACYQLQSLTHNDEWTNKAFRFAEKNKAFVLLESVKRNLAASALQSDTLYAKLQQKQAEYALAERNVTEAALQNDTAYLQQSKEQLKKADEDLLQAKSNFQFANTSYRTLMEKEDTINISAAAKLLTSSDAALLEYFYGDSSAYCFYITATGKAIMQKLNDSLAVSVNQLLQFFKEKNTISENPLAYNNAAYNLYHALALNTVDKNISKLTIIPDGNLSFVPFDALIAAKSSSPELASYNYLVKNFEMNYGFSAATLLAQLHTKNANSNAIIFTPIFAHHERGLAHLQYSGGETESMPHVSPKYFTNSSATLHTFKTYASAAGLIHIASHASAAGTPHVEFIDSALYMNELYAMHLQANLVVISACETGMGTLEKGEGAMSLARGFYYAGAQNVITSLWNADDKSTAQLFKSFYASGQNNYAEALAAAKRNYLQQNLSAAEYSPYYWAGFSLTGSGDAAQKSNTYFFALIAAALLGIFIFIYRKNKKSKLIIKK